MLKRVLSFCLSVALVLSMVPAQAFATEPETVPIETVAETTVPETTREETSPVTEPQGTTAPIETQIPETTAPTAAESVPETTAEETVPETTVEETVSETTVEETVSETTEETVPETTVEETVPEATEEETVPETTEETIVEETVEETVAEEAVAGGSCGSALVWDYANGVLTITTKYSNYGGDMNDYSTSSRPGWYSSYRTSIKEIVVERGVFSIGDYAFVGLTNLEKVSLSKDSWNISEIGAYAFQGCTKLKEVSGIEEIHTIGEGAFAQCSMLNGVNLEYVRNVGTGAFKDCTSLTSITLSKSGSSSGTLGESIFSGCTGLKEVALYVNPTKYMFENCTALETVTMSSSLVTEIGAYAFQGCTALKTVEFSSYITTIGSYAFKNAGLKYIYFLGNAPTINSYAFYGVSASARYPYGNTTWTSSKCANYGGTLSWSYDNRCGDGVTWYLNTSSGALTISGSGAMKDYGGGWAPWYSARSSITKIVVSSGVTSIGRCAFYYLNCATGVTIPSTVTSIGSYAFFGCNAVTSVTIPSSVKTIGDFAFQSCTAMTSLTLNSGLTDIGKHAFQNCYNLTGITLPESTATIGAYAFGGCVKLPSMTIPAGVTSIGGMAFGGCNGLTEIWVNPANQYYCSDDYGILYDKAKTLLIKAPTCLSGSFAIPETVQTIEIYAFDDCVEMTEVTIPDSVTTIEQCAFYYCSGLTTVNMGSGVTTIGKQAFDNCSALTAIVIPEGVTTVGEYTFRKCSALETVTFPEGLTTIDGYAFYDCDSLEPVTFPEGLTTIGKCAFYDCDSLKTVSVPATVTSIGSHAFGNCDSLTAISVDEENAAYASDTRGVLFDKDMTTLIHAPGGLTDGYAVPGAVTTIASNAFAACKKLLAVYIPSTVTTIIGASAGFGPFYQCSTGLVLYCEEYSAPSGWGADWNGYGSTTSTLTVKWGVTAEEGAFWVADAFAETVVIPEYLSSLPECAFYGHTNLKTVTIPEGITTLPKSVFSGCTGLTKVNMHKRLTTFEDYAFKGCTGFKAFYIPATVTSITAYTFNSCDSNMIFYCEATEAPSGWASSWNGSRKVVWGATEDIYDFWSSEEVQNANVVIPEGITQIPDYAFYKRTDLLSVTVPDSVTSIGQYAFYGCTGLTEAPIGNGVESIGTYAFYGCTGLKHAFIPASVTTITSKPFYGCSTSLVVYCEVSARPDTWSETWTQVGSSSSNTLTAHYGASRATYDFFTSDAVLEANVVIPEGVTIIPSYVFKNRTDLLSVTIPSTVTDIGNYAFQNCTGLTCLDIPGSVKAIGSYAFSGCTALEEVILGSGVEEIGSQAFRSCSALKTLFIPDTVTTMGDSLFYCASQTAVVYCEPASQPESWPSGWRTASNGSTSKSLTVRWNFSEAFFRFLMSEAGQAAEVVIPEGFTTIPDYAFAGRTDMTGVTIPNGITSIGEGAFQGCTGLVSVIIPDGVTSIGEYAFQDCTGLRRVYIPASVTSIPGDYWIPSGASYAYYLCNSPFEGCNSALVLYCEAEEKPEGWEKCWNCYYLYNHASWYTLNVVWGISQEEMQTWFEAVQQSDVVIPESVTSIPAKAFYNRTDLTSVTIGENVTTIGASAFYGCTGLTEVTIPESVTTIGASAFYGCTGLTEITIPITVTSVGNKAFYGCTNLTIKYEGTMEQWMEIGYSPCTVQCSDGTIDGFGSCGTSAKWTLIDGQLRIYGSGAMTTYTTSSTAPWYSLQTKITSAVIESGVTTVGGYAFYGCTNLASVEIASTVTTVYSYVFRNCSGLKTVVFQGNAPTFNSYSFSAITTTAYYPAGDTTWTDSVKQNYGGTVTWVATCLGEHTVVVDAAVSATCLETGLTEGSHCSACGMILVAQTTVASLGHDYGEWTDTKVATCTTGGTQRRDCSRCDAYETQIIYALGHDEVTDAYVAPTCTGTGLTEGVHCDRCGLVITAQQTVAALGHTEVVDAAVAATCTATGLTEGRHCSRCNEILIQQQVVPMEEHPYGDWTVTLAPTCTAAGSESRSCTVCGHTETRSVDALGHKEIIDAAVAATCLTAGLTEGKHCSRCAEILVAQTVTVALGHKEVTDKAVAPTCTAAGKTEGSHCSRCAAVFTAQEVIPALGHIEVTDAAVAATCLKTGLTEGSHCERCSTVLVVQQTISALGHKEVIDAAAAPTCLETGLTEGKHCSRCNEILIAQTVLPALGHVETVNPGVDATCLESGWTEGKFCSRCGEILVGREIIEALGHVEAVDAAVAPDCINTGLTEGSHCERCSTVLVAQEEIPALGHEEVTDAAVAPACLETGLTEGRHCARCEEILVAQEVIDATGHDYFYGICRNCADEIPSDYQLYASKSLTLKLTNPATGKAYKTKELIWEMEDIFEPFATLKNGKFTAKKVVERVRLGVRATVVATGEEISYLIDIYPALTQVEVKKDEEIVNGKTLVMDFAQETITLTVDAYPLDTLEKVTWTVSDKKGQYAEYTADGNRLIIANPTGRAGTVTIKATVEAGVKKNVTVKVKFGNYARVVTILDPEKTTLRGGESMQLQAYVSEPAAVSTPGIVWTSSDKTVATVTSAGKVTAKAVAHPTSVTLTATSKDGQASASIELQILPKDEGKLVIREGSKFITNSTKAMNVGDSCLVSAAVVSNGEAIPAEAVWTSSKETVAVVDQDGRIIATGSGTAKITATFNGLTAVLNIKVATLVNAMEITTKDGKNLSEENGEKIVLLSSGKSVALVANVLTAGAGKTVDWAITEGAQYAKIANGKITANKDLTSVRYITVKATAKDGSGVSATIRVKILPLATGVQIFENGTRVRSNTTYIVDMQTKPAIKLTARVYPARANQTVVFTSSNKKIADFNENGELVCYKTGTVTITATAQDGSGAKTTFKLTVIKRITDLQLKDGLQLDENGNLFVAGGKSLKLAAMVQINPADATNKKLTWSVAPNEYGIKVSSTGTLTTKKVAQPVTVNIMVTAQDGSGCMLSFNVTVYPV